MSTILRLKIYAKTKTVVKHLLYTYKTELSKSSNRKNSSAQDRLGPKLTKGLLCLIVLQLLEAKQMHKYEMIRKIRKTFGLNLPISTIYPVLKTLETRGYITTQNIECESTRKVYDLTNKGLCVLGYNDASRNLACAQALLPIAIQEYSPFKA